MTPYDEPAESAELAVLARIGPSDQAHRLRMLASDARAAAKPAPAQAPPPVSPPAARAPLIAIASGKGGVGKTNIAVNLAIALQALDRRVTLIDADLGVANADILCGLSPRRRLNPTAAINAAPDFASLAIPAPGGFTLLPGSTAAPRLNVAARTGREALLTAVAAAEQTADYVLADTGAGIGPLVTGLVGAADLALIVTTPEPTAIADAYALIKCVHTRLGPDDLPNLGIIVNQVTSADHAARVHARLTAATAKFLRIRPPLFAAIRSSRHVPRAVTDRVPFMLTHRRCSAARDIRRLASVLRRFPFPGSMPTTRPSFTPPAPASTQDHHGNVR